MKKSEKFFSTLLEEWLEQTKEQVKHSTYCKYEQITRLHLKPYFKSIDCALISQKIIRAFYESLNQDPSNEKKLSTTSLRCVCMILNRTLGYGYEHGYLQLRLKLSPKLSRDRHLVRVFSKENQSLLEQYLFDHPSLYACAILLALYSGIRIGELCALRYDDLNLADGYLKIVRTVQRSVVISQQKANHKKTELVISEPKSKNAYRLIPLPNFIIVFLKEHLLFSESHPYLFSTSGITPLDPRTLQYFYKNTLEKIQVPYLNFHCLRHTFATRCITLGWDIRTLSEILGHADIKITMEYYFHSSMEYKKIQMQKFKPLIQCAG